MLLIRSPSIIFAFIFSIISIILTILTFNIGNNHPDQHIQFLIILPPLNSIFIFLLSLTWIERRFRLSYIPFVCLIILFLSSLTITIISILFLSLSHIYLFQFEFLFSFYNFIFLINSNSYYIIYQWFIIYSSLSKYNDNRTTKYSSIKI